MRPDDHAFERLPDWMDGWRRAGRLVLLLDFDGTLAPIVNEPGSARMLEPAAVALTALASRPGVQLAIISGRGLEDVRGRCPVDRIAFAGNHGLELSWPDGETVHHPEAVALRPQLEEAASELAVRLRGIPGVLVEDKGLSLTVHYRLAGSGDVPAVLTVVEGVVESSPLLRLSPGKMTMEVRPGIACDKGTAVAGLLEEFDAPPSAPILYLGDDVTDEDAFRAVREWPAGEGILVRGADVLPASADPPTAATSWLSGPDEVALLLERLAGSS